jgi:hypothetical protein
MSGLGIFGCARAPVYAKRSADIFNGGFMKTMKAQYDYKPGVLPVLNGSFDEKAELAALEEKILKLAPTEVILGPQGLNSIIEGFTRAGVNTILKKLGKADSELMPQAKDWREGVKLGIGDYCMPNGGGGSKVDYVEAEWFLKRLYDAGIRAGQIKD